MWLKARDTSILTRAKLVSGGNGALRNLRVDAMPPNPFVLRGAVVQCRLATYRDGLRSLAKLWRAKRRLRPNEL